MEGDFQTLSIYQLLYIGQRVPLVIFQEGKAKCSLAMLPLKILLIMFINERVNDLIQNLRDRRGWFNLDPLHIEYTLLTDHAVLGTNVRGASKHAEEDHDTEFMHTKDKGGKSFV